MNEKTCCAVEFLLSNGFKKVASLDSFATNAAECFSRTIESSLLPEALRGAELHMQGYHSGGFSQGVDFFTAKIHLVNMKGFGSVELYKLSPVKIQENLDGLEDRLIRAMIALADLEN